MAPGRRRSDAARSQTKGAVENFRLAEMASGSPQVKHASRPPFVWHPRKKLGGNDGDRAQALGAGADEATRAFLHSGGSIDDSDGILAGPAGRRMEGHEEMEPASGPQ